MTALKKIAQQMVSPGKGLLAADESTATAGKRLELVGLANTEGNRQAFRDMLLATPGLGKYISGVILYDETIRQHALDGRNFVDILQSEGILPGIKVDGGLDDTPSGEKLTKGLEGLDARLQEYVKLGATFCKWRATFSISPTTPTEDNIRQNAKEMAQYALLCQKNGLVPIVEPEVLIDGNHTREQAGQVTGHVLSILFEELENAHVFLEGLILKTSMVISGKESGEKQTPEDVAKDTLAVFEKVIPAHIGGVVFLSGGQESIEATENLNAMHQGQHLSWPLTFSYSRALENDAILAWQGKNENVEKAQKVLLHRAHMNSLASLGKYTSDLEKELS